MNHSTIGVFDSGIGGLSVARAIEREFPEERVVFMNDSAHVPYGNKDPEELLTLVHPILQALALESDIIVVACNTVTTTIMGTLREEISVPLIGVEPMVQAAAHITQSGKIAVCATPTTLRSDRYIFLKETYAQGIDVIEPDCSDWASMIESNAVNRHVIRERITSACDRGADTIVLGCTHYHWIEDIIQESTNGRAITVQPEDTIVTQLRNFFEARVLPI